MTFIEKWRELAHERVNEALDSEMKISDKIFKKIFEAIQKLNIDGDIEELISELDEIDGEIEGIMIEEVYTRGLRDGLKGTVQKQNKERRKLYVNKKIILKYDS